MESLKRFYEPEEIHDPKMILYVGVMGLVVNLLGLCLFHEHGSAHGHSHGGGKLSLIYFWGIFANFVCGPFFKADMVWWNFIQTQDLFPADLIRTVKAFFLSLNQMLQLDINKIIL